MSGTLQTKDGVILLFFYSVDVGHNKISGTMTFWSCFIVYFCRTVFFFFNCVDGGHNKVSVTMNFWSCFSHYSCKTCCLYVKM